MVALWLSSMLQEIGCTLTTYMRRPTGVTLVWKLSNDDEVDDSKYMKELI